MPDGEDTAMEAMQPSGLDSPLDRPASQAEIDELPVTYHSVLGRCELRDQAIPAVSPLFPTIWVVRGGFTGHAPRIARTLSRVAPQMCQFWS